MTKTLSVLLGLLTTGLCAGQGQGPTENNKFPPPPRLPSSLNHATLSGPQSSAQSAPTPLTARSKEDAAVPDAIPSLPHPENLTRFDPLAVELKYDDRRWVLAAGKTVLKDFGRNELEARQAWYLIRELRLNQHATIGSPRPIVEYWLHDGQAPDHLPHGIRSLPLDPAHLHVERAQGFWVVREPVRVLFNFGSNEADAKQALAVLQRYGFNQVGLVGQAVPSMLVFAARPQADPQHLGSQRMPSAPRPGHGPGGLAQKPSDREASEAASFYPSPVLPGLRSGVQPLQPVKFRHPRGGFPAWHDEVSATGVTTRETPFDWRQVQVRHDAGDWKLTAGGQVLANFGNSERDARLAQAAFIHYRLTEQRQIGTPTPVAGYFLSNGQPPQGVMPGLLGDSFHPESLNVRQVGEHYCLAERSHTILDCGPHEEDARHLLQVVRQYRFDNLCRIGPDDQHTLRLLVRSH
jgi:hypothetical protein